MDQLLVCDATLDPPVFVLFSGHAALPSCTVVPVFKLVAPLHDVLYSTCTVCASTRVFWAQFSMMSRTAPFSSNGLRLTVTLECETKLQVVLSVKLK